MEGGHYTTGRSNKKESDLVHNVQGMYKKSDGNLESKNKENGRLSFSHPIDTIEITPFRRRVSDWLQGENTLGRK